jgi:uncharacterized protein
MENRASVVTLGVADVARARAFYESIGWSGESPDGDVVFFQAGGMILALCAARSWPRTVPWRTRAAGAESRWPTTCPRRPRSMRCSPLPRRPEPPSAARGPDVLGRLLRIFVDLDGHPWDVAHNPGWILADDGSVHLPG